MKLVEVLFGVSKRADSFYIGVANDSLNYILHLQISSRPSVHLAVAKAVVNESGFPGFTTKITIQNILITRLTIVQWPQSDLAVLENLAERHGYSGALRASDLLDPRVIHEILRKIED